VKERGRGRDDDDETRKRGGGQTPGRVRNKL